MMRHGHGQLVRRDWSEISLDAAYAVVVTATVVVASLTLHPSGLGRIVVPILLAVGAMNVGATAGHLIKTWRHVAVSVDTRTWPAAEELDGRGGAR